MRFFKPKEQTTLDYRKLRDDLRQRHSRATGELRECEKTIGVASHATEPTQLAARARGRELRDELASLDRRIRDLEPQVAAAATARKRDAAQLVPGARQALQKLTDALDTVAVAAVDAEQHRLALHQAGGATWKRIPAEVLVLPGSKTLVERAKTELEGAR